MTTTFTYRHAGPATECETCGEPSIYGFDMRTGTKVVVVCATCAAEATDSTPCETCETCGESVPVDQFHGNTRPDGTSEYLCSDCYIPDPQGNFQTPGD